MAGQTKWVWISLGVLIPIVFLVALGCYLFHFTKCCKKKNEGENKGDEDQDEDAEAQKVLLDAEGKEGGKEHVIMATTKVTESPIIKGRGRAVGRGSEKMFEC